MNLIDAVRSGKPFKQINWAGWIVRRENTLDSVFEWQDKGIVKNFNLKDILSSDWETQEKRIEISESQLDEILCKLIPTKPSFTPFMICSISLKKELGF